MKQHKRTHRSVIVSDDATITGDSKWTHVASQSSTTNGNTPPTPASNRSLSSRSSNRAPLFTIESPEASRRVKRQSISSTSSTSSRIAGSVGEPAGLCNETFRPINSSRRRRLMS
jgi:hypothetical protein